MFSGGAVVRPERRPAGLLSVVLITPRPPADATPARSVLAQVKLFFATTRLSVKNDIFVTMSRVLLVFLAMCAFTIAMVPRDRRAVNPDEQEKSKEEVTLCDPTTPCAWSVYRPVNKIIDLNITNAYCRCGAGLVCSNDEDNPASSSFVFRCREPGHKMSDS